MILHTYELVSGWEVVFSHSHGRRKEMILHTYELVSGFFNSHMKRNEMILHTCEPTNDVFIHIGEEK
jgi:hypothetical protein